MELLVQKFGGTSIGNPERLLNVAEIVRHTIEEKEQRVIVVLSAISSRIKQEGTTSRLLEAANNAIIGGGYYRILDLLEEHHIDITKKTIHDRKIAEQISEEISAEFHKLKLFLDAIHVIGEISPRSNDVIISTGEKLSARIFSGILTNMGQEAEYINLENILDQKFVEVGKDFCEYLRNKMVELINVTSGKIPVVTGFFGYTEKGIINSIGRGYTDFTAAVIAAGHKAKELQIWKEVDGIFTADPNKVKEARVLSRISPDEALELTYFGSEVIHPFTMEQVSSAKVPVRIKNTFNPSLPGTIIDPNFKEENSKKGPTAVTVKRDVTILNIRSNRMLMAYGFMTRVFDVLNRYKIVIDLISTSEINISMSIDSADNLEAAIPELEQLGSVSIDKGMAILSLVGQGMRHYRGLAGEMFSRLAQVGINVEMISQGASEINISCAILETDSDKALRAVHEMIINEKKS